MCNEEGINAIKNFEFKEDITFDELIKDLRRSGRNAIIECKSDARVAAQEAASEQQKSDKKTKEQKRAKDREIRFSSLKQKQDKAIENLRTSKNPLNVLRNKILKSYLEKKMENTGYIYIQKMLTQTNLNFLKNLKTIWCINTNI